jgi:hypothetical protein
LVVAPEPGPEPCVNCITVLAVLVVTPENVAVIVALPTPFPVTKVVALPLLSAVADL